MRWLRRFAVSSVILPSFFFGEVRTSVIPEFVSNLWNGGSRRNGQGPWNVHFAGVGAAVPNTLITNDDISKIVETSHEWISSRTGIESRKVILPTESLQELASQASLSALKMADIEPSAVDAIILASTTPDDLFGDGTAIAGRIGAVNAVAFDVRAACSGFVISMITASQYIHSGVYRTVLVVGSDALSRWVDWTDRNTCILFGDGAGAVVMTASSMFNPGMFGFMMRSDPTNRHQLSLPRGCGAPNVRLPVSAPGGISKSADLAPERYGNIRMNGREVYKFASTDVPRTIKALLDREGISIHSVDGLLLHQANSRILTSVAAELKLPKSKVLYKIKEYGNTSAASIPLALNDAVAAGEVKPGQTIIVAAFGAGLTWGATVIRWQ